MWCFPRACCCWPWGRRERQDSRWQRRWAAAWPGALLLSKVLIPALGIPDETASGIYSVCFQQSARVLRDHGDTVTPEEYAEIDRVLDAEKLPELYETNISDR